jgi:hypothetical protein
LQAELLDAQEASARSVREAEAVRGSMAAELEELQAALRVGGGVWADACAQG